MRALDLDFVDRRRRQRRLLIAIVMSLFFFPVTTYLGYCYKQTAQEMDQLNTALKKRAELRRRPEPIPMTPQQIEISRAEIKEVNKIIDDLSTPWDTLFRIFESTVDDDTVLLALEPQTDRDELLVTAETRNFSTMQTYLARLRESPSLRDIYISSHEVQQQDPQHPVRFVINAKWDKTAQK